VRLTHARLLVRNFGASFRFWRDIVGLKVTFGEEAGPYADFDTGDATLAINDAAMMERAIAIAAQDDPTRTAQVMLILAVDDVDQATAELEQRGVRFASAPTDQPDWGIRVSHFRDPDGHLVELYTPLRPAPAA
jgi:lactoylglutathione lyase